MKAEGKFGWGGAGPRCGNAPGSLGSLSWLSPGASRHSCARPAGEEDPSLGPWQVRTCLRYPGSDPPREPE